MVFILFLKALLFAICANIDNLSIGITYGIQKIKISILPNFIIALITLFGTILSMKAGAAATSFLSPDFTKILGGAILIFIGIYYLIKEFFKKSKNLDNEETKSLNKITIKESIILGFALTINNFGMGIGVGLGNSAIALINALTFIFSMIFVVLGNYLGESLISKFLGKYSEIISGLIMVLIGVFQILG